MTSIQRRPETILIAKSLATIKRKTELIFEFLKLWSPHFSLVLFDPCGKELILNISKLSDVNTAYKYEKSRETAKVKLLLCFSHELASVLVVF